MVKYFDLIVIGSGPAGEKAAVKAAYFGRKVALVEKADKLGGAGVNTGTLPSKTLKETVLYYSGKYLKGLYRDDFEANLDNSIQKFLYRERLVCTSMEQDVRTNLQRHQVTVFSGNAKFKDQHHIQIEGIKEELIRGDHIVIATGSYPFHPKGIPFDSNRVHDSDSILHIDRLPRSIAIVGAGVIGCEYATIFANLGIPVFLINKQDRILEFLDHEMSSCLVEQMAKGGVDIIFNGEIESLESPESREEPIHITLTTGETLHVDMFLFAAGRSGNTSSLDLAQAGVELGSREQIVVDQNYRTSVPHIYAVGDVIGFPALASTSMDQGRVAVAHMYDTKDLDSLPKSLPYGIYTIPEVSMVGATERQCLDQGIAYCVGRAFHKDMARGRIMGLEDGMMKIIFRKDDLVIIGVHVIGSQASEIIHYGLSLVENEKTLLSVIATVFNYPTLHDLYKYASYDGLGSLNGHKLKGK